MRAVVVGAGYVGLVTAVGLAELGHRVHVVEIRRDRLAMLQRGIAPFHEPGLPDALSAALRERLLTVSASPDSGQAVDVALVCVGTPIAADGRSDLSQLRSALAELVPILGEERVRAVLDQLSRGDVDHQPRLS
jgi:UDPglucose 6-dehydrogenase